MSSKKNPIKSEKSSDHNFKILFSFRKSAIISKSNDGEYKGILKLNVWLIKKRF